MEKANKDLDKDGELGKRLTSSLDQEKLMLRLEILIKDSGLKVSTLNLDLKRLKNLRDKVAHTGRINVVGQDVFELLQSGVKGLQLILLKRLEYDGLVNDAKDNWRTMENISNYFE